MKRITQVICAAGVVALASLLLSSFAPLTRLATAQRAEKKQLLNLTIQHVKPELFAEFSDFTKNTTLPLQLKGGLKAKYVWRSERGDRFDFLTFVPMESYATIGTVPDSIRAALGNDAATALYYQTSRKFLTGTEILTVEAQPDLSWTNPKLTGQPQLAIMRWQHAAPGRAGEYESFLKSYIKSVSQSEMLGQWRFRLRFGGDTTTYLMLRPLASTAELDAGDPLINKLGETEARKIYNQLAPGVLARDEAYLIRFRPDLSIIDGKVDGKAINP
ncbi:MAG: hypothetical protein HY011_09065 [Acidobacteria bacterium]|nr:hypothetical protein [Acidobacteriota bacterium]